MQDKPRWLVFNKMDLMPEDEWQGRVEQILEALEWSGPSYSVSAMDGRGTEALCRDIMEYLENLPTPNPADSAPAIADDPFASLAKNKQEHESDQDHHDADHYESEEWSEEADDRPL